MRSHTCDTYLVQRILRAHVTPQGSTSVDRCFRWDCMGSSEFEFDALPAAWRRFKALSGKARPIVPIVVVYGTRQAWFVGAPGSQDMAERFFVDQLTKRKWDLKERSDIRRRYGPVKGLSEMRRPVGWFAVDQVEPWALFAERRDADMFLVCAGLKEVDGE